MKKLFYFPSLFTVFLCLAHCVTAVQSAEKFTGQITFSYDYLLHLPDGYDASGDTLYPFVLYLHGSGERGDVLEKIKKHGPPKFLDNKPGMPAIVVSPQCPSGEFWQPIKLKAMLDEILSRFPIDPSRIYLTGNSMGGAGTWELASHYPRLFAAIAPICGYGSPRRVSWTLKYTPVWVFHGLKDPVVKIEESLKLVRALEAVDGNVRLTVYPEAEHDAWTQAYESPELWEWLFAQRLPEEDPRPPRH